MPRPYSQDLRDRVDWAVASGSLARFAYCSAPGVHWGHSQSDARTTKRYAVYAPDYLGQARRTVDGIITDLKGKLRRDPADFACELRASGPKSRAAKYDAKSLFYNGGRGWD